MADKQKVIEIIERGILAETIELPAAQLIPILRIFLKQDKEIQRLTESNELAKDLLLDILTDYGQGYDYFKHKIKTTLAAMEGE